MGTFRHAGHIVISNLVRDPLVLPVQEISHNVRDDDNFKQSVIDNFASQLFRGQHDEWASEYKKPIMLSYHYN